MPDIDPARQSFSGADLKQPWLKPICNSDKFLWPTDHLLFECSRLVLPSNTLRIFKVPWPGTRAIKAAQAPDNIYESMCSAQTILLFRRDASSGLFVVPQGVFVTPKGRFVTPKGRFGTAPGLPGG